MKVKLTKEMKHWADNIQTKPLPSWAEAFKYALDLGKKLEREKLNNGN